MCKKIAVLAVVVFFMSAAAQAVQAAPLDVRVDFNDQPWDVPSGSGFAEPIGWNVISKADLDGDPTGVQFSLKDFNTGLDTPVTLEITNGFYQSSTNDDGVLGWSSPDAPWVVDTVLRDYAMAYSSGNPCQLTLGGLDTDSVYQIELLSVRNTGSSTGEFKVTDRSGQIAVDDTTLSNAWQPQLYGFSQKKVMRWSNVFADPITNQVVIDVKYTKDYAFLNGMRITELPEPSTFMIAMGLFVAGFGMSRPRGGRSRKGGASRIGE